MNVVDRYKDEFLGALSRDWSAMDFRTFEDTADVFAFDPLIAHEWTRLHTIPMLDAAEASGMPDRQTAGLLHNPSSIRSMLCYDLLMAKCAHVGVEAYTRIFQWYASVLAAICIEDLFAFEFHNRIHHAREIAELKKRGVAATPDIARALGRLSNACYNLSYGLYSDMNPQLVYDNYGPYDDHDGMFVIKHFGNLRPRELWPETEKIPVNVVWLGLLYEGVSLKVDAATHAIFDGDTIHGLRTWWCESDMAQYASIDTISSMQRSMEACAISIYQKIKSMSYDEKKRLYVLQKAWGYKKLFDALGMEWRPAQSILDAITRERSFTGWKIPHDRERHQQFLKEVFDPTRELGPEHL